jgi:hypothetical protein
MAEQDLNQANIGRPTPEQRRRFVQAIWRRAPFMPLPLRLKNLRRAQQLF